MGIGENLYNSIAPDLQWIVIIILVGVGVYLIIKRQFTGLIGLLVVGVLAVGLVFNPMGAKDVLLGLFNKILGIG